MHDICGCIEGWTSYLDKEGNIMDFEWNYDSIRLELQGIWNNRAEHYDETVNTILSFGHSLVEMLRSHFGETFPDLFEWIDTILLDKEDNRSSQQFLLTPGDD